MKERGKEWKRKKKRGKIKPEADQNKQETTVQWVHLQAPRDEPKVAHMYSHRIWSNIKPNLLVLTGDTEHAAPESEGWGRDTAQGF